MVYIHGVGLHAGGALAQSASGGEQLAAGLARGGNEVALGRRAFQTGLGCAGCHGLHAQGARGPCLSGGIHLESFRHTHGDGLFPPAFVTDRMVAALDAWLRTDPAGPAVCRRGG
jgi:mono/diheme cytochrome c family protein